jgi:hypothetical protein
MPLPSQSVAATASPLAAPMARPAAAAPVRGKASAPFWPMFDPTLVELYDLTNLPAETLEAAGIEAGCYWLPRLVCKPAVPGVNGVIGDPTWTTEDLLQHGHREALTSAGRDAGVQLLDPYLDIPAAFLPPGIPAGSLIRRQAVIHNGETGNRYMTCWEILEATAPNRPARVRVARDYLGAWIAALVRTGQIAAANEAIVNEHKARYKARISRHQLENLPAEVKAARIEKAEADAARVDVPVLDEAQVPTPLKKGKGKANG